MKTHIKDWFWFLRSAKGSSEKRDKEGSLRSGRPFSQSLVLPDNAEKVNTPYHAMMVATVYRCVRLISDKIAGLPFTYMRQRNGVYVPEESGLNYLLQVQPCARLNAFDFWASAVAQILLQGNAYIMPIYDIYTAKGYRELILLSPDSVSYDKYSHTYTVNDTDNGIYGTYDEDDIIHLKNYSFDGVTGESVLTAAARTFGIAATGDRETLDRFASGGNVRGFVSDNTQTPTLGRYDTDEVNKHVEDIEANIRQGRHLFVLDGDLKLTQLSMTSTDMQFLESRKFTVRDICRFFGVHPSFVFDDTSNNYKSAETADASFLSNTLQPLLKRIEIEFCRKIISPRLCTKYKFEFDRSALYACDLESKVNYQSKMIAAGLSTVNEERRKENKPAVDGGDTLLISANLKNITELTTSAASKTS
jgi:HK97 family phage portal protein